jgi:hypothetical protein
MSADSFAIRSQADNIARSEYFQLFDPKRTRGSVLGRRVGCFRIVDRHRQGLLAEPPTNGVDVGAGFDQQRADGVAQAMERQAVADESLVS